MLIFSIYVSPISDGQANGEADLQNTMQAMGQTNQQHTTGVDSTPEVIIEGDVNRQHPIRSGDNMTELRISPPLSTVGAIPHHGRILIRSLLCCSMRMPSSLQQNGSFISLESYAIAMATLSAALTTCVLGIFTSIFRCVPDTTAVMN
jgi:hypothetical protein